MSLLEVISLFQTVAIILLFMLEADTRKRTGLM